MKDTANKKFRKLTTFKVDNIKNDTFEYFKNSKITPQNPETKILKKINYLWNKK